MVYHFLARRTNVRQETPLDWTKSQKNTKDVYLSRNEKTLEIKNQNMSYASLYKSMHLLYYRNRKATLKNWESRESRILLIPVDILRKMFNKNKLACKQRVIQMFLDSLNNNALHSGIQCLPNKPDARRMKKYDF